MDAGLLYASADTRSPKVAYPGATATEQLLNAHADVRARVLRIVAKGSELDFDQTAAASANLSAQIQQKGDLIKARLDAGADLEEAYAIALSADEIRAYVLGQYYMAAEGMGAIQSGYATYSVERGLMSQAAYDDMVAVKLSVFQRLAGLDEAGELARLLDPGAAAQEVLLKSGVSQEQVGAKLAATTKLVFSRGKTGVQVGNTATAGLGFVWTPGAVAVVLLVVSAVVAGIVAWSLESQKIEATARLARERCLEADKYGFAEVQAACNKNVADLSPKGAATGLFGGDTMKSLTTWLAVGAIAYVGLLILPQLTQSVTATREVIARSRERR